MQSARGRSCRDRPRPEELAELFRAFNLEDAETTTTVSPELAEILESERPLKAGRSQ